MKHKYLYSPCAILLGLTFSLLLPSCMFMEYNRAMEIRAVDKAYSAGQITAKQREQKIAAIRKSYAEYEAQWVANMKAQAARNEANMISQGSVYTYTPQPQSVYVYNQDPGPKPTYIPPPQTYVYNQDPGPRPTYIPPPETYIYNQDPGPKPTYIPPPQRYVYSQDPGPKPTYIPPQQTYASNRQPQHSQQAYVPDVPPKYVYRKDMTPAEQKKFDAMFPKMEGRPIDADTFSVFKAKYAEEQQGVKDVVGETGLKVYNKVVDTAGTALLTKKIPGPPSKVEASDSVLRKIIKFFTKNRDDNDPSTSNASGSGTSTKSR